MLPSAIENSELVIQHFGYWPSFHDAEIASFCFDRNFEEGYATISLKVYAFEMTDKKLGNHFKLIKHCWIEIEFRGVTDSEVDGFNHQNAVNGINFSQQGNYISCDIEPAFGIGATIVAQRVIVKNLSPLGSDPKRG